MPQIKVLVCDDHENIREAVNLILNTPEYALHFALDGHEAIKKAAKLKPDVILLDIKMPKLCGLDAIEQIKTAVPETSIIMMSGYEQPEVIKEALSRGAIDYLPKSFSGAQLKTSIQTALKQRK